MFARLMMFTVVVLALAAGSQAKAAPLSYGTYYDEEEVSASCNSTTVCRAGFSALPSDHLLLLKKINCEIVSNEPVIYVTVSIAQTSGGPPFGRGIYVSPGSGVLTNAGQYVYSFQTDAQILIGQGRYPFIEVNYNLTSTSFMFCGILGDLVTPIQ
jgi:hypothetical protein